MGIMDILIFSFYPKIRLKIRDRLDHVTPVMRLSRTLNSGNVKWIESHEMNKICHMVSSIVERMTSEEISYKLQVLTLTANFPRRVSNWK